MVAWSCSKASWTFANGCFHQPSTNVCSWSLEIGHSHSTNQCQSSWITVYLSSTEYIIFLYIARNTQTFALRECMHTSWRGYPPYNWRYLSCLWTLFCAAAGPADICLPVFRQAQIMPLPASRNCIMLPLYPLPSPLSGSHKQCFSFASSPSRLTIKFVLVCVSQT